MARVRLLSTDFDGTLVGPSSDGRCSLAFAAALQDHHQRGGLWAINTGRSLEHMIEGLEIFAPPVLPDFLLVHEREIHSRIGGGWTAHAEWNNSCRERHAQLYGMAGEVFAAIEQMAGESGNTITLLYEEHGLAGLVTRTEEVMACVAENVGQMASRLPDFSFQRNTVYMRFCHRDYHKGSVLRELCDLVNIHRDEVLAAGDHFNDLSMLDGENAAMTACPANAIDPVKEIVRRAGGHVAEKSWADGIAEALCYYESPRSRRDQACA